MPWWLLCCALFSYRSLSDGIRLDAEPPLLLTRLPEKTSRCLWFEAIWLGPWSRAPVITFSIWSPRYLSVKLCAHFRLPVFAFEKRLLCLPSAPDSPTWSSACRFVTLPFFWEVCIDRRFDAKWRAYVELYLSFPP